jgi:integrase
MNLLRKYLKEHASRSSPQTVRTVTLRLKSFSKWARAKHGEDWLSVESVNGFILHLRKSVSLSTLRAYQSVLNAFFVWLINWGHLDKNPLKQATARVTVMAKSRKEVFSPEEYARIKAETVNCRQKYWAPAVIIAWNTGLRLSDIALLESSEVDLALDCLRLKPAKTARYGTEVEIPLSGELRPLLTDLCAKSEGSYLLPDMAGQYQAKPEYLSMQFSRILERAGIAGKNFHLFRHSYVTRALNLNVNPAVIATMTGQTLKVILSYAHPSLETKREQMKGML